MTRKHYELADEYSANAYRVVGYSGIAWYVLGWETRPDSETEWSGYKPRTGNLVCVMVGDDRYFSFHPSDVSPLSDDEYCVECGQIGCGHGV